MMKLLTLATVLTIVTLASPVQLRSTSQLGPPKTITICKRSIPSGATGFPFTWANGAGALPPFTLNDGQCITKDVSNKDSFNKFTENVPSGWTLTDISCNNKTTPVKIIGGDPNPGFQPGDNTVTMDLIEPNVTCTFVNQRQTPVDPCCPPWNKDMLKDMLVYKGTSFSAPYTIQFVPTALFKNQMQAYINYLHSTNSAITAITIDWRLHNQGTGTLPASGYGPQTPPTGFLTWTWNTSGVGNPVSNPATGFFVPPVYSATAMQVGTWYMVHTGIYLENGQTFFSKKCADVEVFFRVQFLSKMKNENPTLEISDGQNIIQRVPIDLKRTDQIKN
jgi:hypothetical protein